jgi:hypothetical protein
MKTGRAKVDSHGVRRYELEKNYGKNSTGGVRDRNTDSRAN